MNPVEKRRIVVASLAAAVTVGAAFAGWLCVAGRGCDRPPSGLSPIGEGDVHRVFVYGTLRDPLTRWYVVRRRVSTRVAILPGYRKRGLDVTPQPGAFTEGEVLVVATEELQRLDRYERVGVRYERVEVKLADGSVAWVYRRLRAR